MAASRIEVFSLPMDEIWDVVQGDVNAILSSITSAGIRADFTLEVAEKVDKNEQRSFRYENRQIFASQRDLEKKILIIWVVLRREGSEQESNHGALAAKPKSRIINSRIPVKALSPLDRGHIFFGDGHFISPSPFLGFSSEIGDFASSQGAAQSNAQYLEEQKASSVNMKSKFELSWCHKSECFKMMGTMLKTWRHTLRDNYYKKYQSDAERLANVPPLVKREQWKEFVAKDQVKAKKMELESTSSNSQSQSLLDDALSHVFGKDTRVRTRGVGSTVPRSSIEASMPAIHLLENEIAEGKEMKGRLHNLETYVKDMNSNISN
ncbi:hypothetical protein LguiA_007365 [Lonicera macranthoides]